ncbi:MAG TPA: hypothetical protein VGO52_16560 [Hyphomonadaceae bacterium]|jgi:hypothetical protein|nr:hypothetical protein [Hyphomonadaceae bacterium]
MKLSRRTLLLGAAAAALPFGLGALKPQLTFDHAEQVLASQFGLDMARSGPARAFTADFVAAYASAPDERIVQSFLESTTFLAHKAGTEEFRYLALFEPYHSPCSNQLSAPLDLDAAIA